MNLNIHIYSYIYVLNNMQYAEVFLCRGIFPVPGYFSIGFCLCRLMCDSSLVILTIDLDLSTPVSMFEYTLASLFTFSPNLD